MGSSILHATEVEEIELLSRQQSEAQRQFRQNENPRAYTSPRALNQFLSGSLPELPDRSRCLNHELLSLSTQTFEENQITFVSTVCAKCYYHFHVKSDAKHSLPYNSEHPNHMLIPHTVKSKDDLRREHTKYNKPEGYVRFVCAARSCNFWLEITTFAPKLSRNEVDMLLNNGRVQLNLKEARDEDPGRYADVPDTYGADTANLLGMYLRDALYNQPSGGGPRKIKKRNKRFRVSFSTDFDPLLRSIGFVEGKDDDDGDPFWLICQPEPKEGATPIGTLRAQVEDVLAEVALLERSKETIPAWEKLLRAFGSSYSNVKADLSIPEDDLALLGCLNDHPPRHFAWAARLLADIRPSHRDKYLQAALRCIRERSDDAVSEVVIYLTQFDAVGTVDKSLQDAYAFFDASGADRDSPDHLLSKYYIIVEADRTDAKKALAQQHLEVIGHHLGKDLVNQIDPQLLHDIGAPALLPAGAGPQKRRMSIKSATQLLGVDAVFSSEMIRDFVLNLDEKTDREKVAEALEVLSELKRQQDLTDEATKLHEFATFFRETGNIPLDVAPADIQQQPQEEPSDYMNRPPGLRNIGNTCYLNSLLQYFYNVKTVRDLINNFDQVKLELDEGTIGKRRTGGNGNTVNLEEAIVARQFVEMLGELFHQLQSTADAAAQPSQKLANTALSSAKDILSERKPPPLPARPSPAPPIPPKEEMDKVQVHVESVNDQLETASSRSSRTLVEDDKATPTDSGIRLVDVDDKDERVKDESTSVLPLPPGQDALMEDCGAPVSLDEKIALVSQRLEQSERAGTAQQDVEEIIGNILEHLMRAIRPDGPMADKPDLQADRITDTFFTMIVNSTAKTTNESANLLNAAVEEDILNEEIIPERWITAFPHPDKENKVKVTLYAALDRYFTYELLSGGSLSRYSTIRSLPPILHICIQRSDASGIKNRNAVVIPEVLYLDRYMEADTGSNLWKVRRRVWAIKERLEELNFRSSQDTQPVIRREDANDWQTSSFFANWDTQPVDDDIYSIDPDPAIMNDIKVPSKRKAAEDSTTLPPPKRASPSPGPNGNGATSELAGALEDLEKNLQRLNDLNSAELSDLQKRAETDFDEMRKEKYSLHAVICHGGGMSAGHYWVWMRDFKKNVWYKYNDSMVTEDVRDSQAVLDELNDSGDPYYVAYVRDEMKHDLVEVPQRRKPDPANAVVSDDVEMQTIDGIELAGTTKLGAPPNSSGGNKAAEAEATTGDDESRPYEIL